jgi:hypothetical protein
MILDTEKVTYVGHGHQVILVFLTNISKWEIRELQRYLHPSLDHRDCQYITVRIMKEHT